MGECNKHSQQWVYGGCTACNSQDKELETLKAENEKHKIIGSKIIDAHKRSIVDWDALEELDKLLKGG